MRFGRRDHERYIGGYDPEHEMPDPDRDPRDRWQSDAYRRNARDSRYMYRWNPDRFEGTRDRDYERAAFDRGYERGYEDRDREYYSRGYPRPFEYDTRADRERWERDYENEYGGRPEDPNLRYYRDRWRRY